MMTSFCSELLYRNINVKGLCTICIV